MSVLDWFVRTLAVIGAVMLVYAIVKVTIGAWQYLRAALRSDEWD